MKADDGADAKPPTLYSSVPSCLTAPPMGWMSWEVFRCGVNCSQDPTRATDYNET
jgi:hypothetical protein